MQRNQGQNLTYNKLEKYEKAKTMGNANQTGTNWQNISTDFKKGYFKFVDVDETEMLTEPRWRNQTNSAGSNTRQGNISKKQNTSKYNALR